MAKIEALSDIGSLANTTAARATINANSERIETAFINTLSRDGSSPNEMGADLDMDSHFVMNVADPVSDGDAVNKRSVGDLVALYANQIIESAGVGRFYDNIVIPVTEGQTVVPYTGITTTGLVIQVFYNGVLQHPGTYTNSAGVLTFSEPFEEAGEILLAVSGDPSVAVNAATLSYTAGVVGSVTRTQQQALDDNISVLSLGLVADGASDINAALTAAISNRKPGTRLRFPAGDYFLAGRVDVVLTSPLALDFDPGAKIIGDATDVPMLTIRGGTARHSVTIRGGHFDNGDRVFNPANQSGTALDLLDTDDFKVTECVFGRKTRDWVDGFGDSGITATRCGRGQILGNTFYGQPDLGIYLTGGASTGATDDYGDIVLSGNRFHRCNTGISVKRQQQRVICTGNTFYECSNGFTIFEAGGIPPGRSSVCSANTFKFMADSCIRVHGAGNCAITGNVMEDFGFDRALVSRSAIAIWLHGASACAVSGNTIRFVDWTADSNHTAISSPQVTIDAIVYTPTGNNVVGNVITNVYRGISESSSGANYYSDNVILGGTTVVSGLNASTFCEYTDATNGKRLFVGATEMTRQNGTTHFVRGLRFFEAATAAAVPSNFTATHYIPINASGTVYYLPVRNAVW